MVHTGSIRLKTRGHSDMHDLTSEVERIVEQCGIARGLVTVFTPSSTSAVTTIEYEQGALEDLRQALERLAPSDAEYRHNLAWGDGNGVAHLRAALLGPSLTIPVVDGRPTLGTWQQVLYIDFDLRPRHREIVVQVMGEAA
ncbi:MAG: secondary thiamine-phosphate synthase enzyme YjbQ [Chloroflexota bacterium]